MMVMITKEKEEAGEERLIDKKKLPIEGIE
jgi:hypothetical protein